MSKNVFQAGKQKEIWQDSPNPLKMSEESSSCNMPEFNTGKTYWNDWRWVKSLQAVICRNECWQNWLERLKMSEKS